MDMLTLILKKRWFDMIASGEKKAEYRDITPYWTVRLLNKCVEKKFNKIKFRHGYARSARTITVEFSHLELGVGLPEWGAPDRPVYILVLGDILDKNF